MLFQATQRGRCGRSSSWSRDPAPDQSQSATVATAATFPRRVQSSAARQSYQLLERPQHASHSAMRQNDCPRHLPMTLKRCASRRWRRFAKCERRRSCCCSFVFCLRRFRQPQLEHHARPASRFQLTAKSRSRRICFSCGTGAQHCLLHVVILNLAHTAFLHGCILLLRTTASSHTTERHVVSKLIL